MKNVLTKNKEFKIWKNVETGRFRSIEEIRNALIRNDVQIRKHGEEIIDEINLTKLIEKNKLVLVSCYDLGLRQGGTCEQIYNRAFEFNLTTCHQEIGPQLCIQYSNFLKNGDWVRIGSETMNTREGYVVIFRICRSVKIKKVLIDATRGHPKAFWPPEFKWVFQKK